MSADCGCWLQEVGSRRALVSQRQNHFMMQDYSKSRLGAAHRAQTDDTSVIFVIPDQEFIGLGFLFYMRAGLSIVQ